MGRRPEANEAWHIERIDDFEDDGPIQAGLDPLAPYAHFQGEGVAALREVRDVKAAGERLPLVHGPVTSLQTSQLPCKVNIKLKVSSFLFVANDEQNSASITLGLRPSRAEHKVTGCPA